ncbi:hypothetical protein AX14_007212 [Amanita brunnescens Koide BX004]|nr:hypothetical protein AX14_007212 [Amanita brunnescens Koide BX004]
MYSTADATGLFSSPTLISNLVIGTSIYASPGLNLHSAGSVGVALIFWVLGSLVYLEYDTSLPKSGDGKNYLEFTFHKPQYSVTCIFAV